MKTIYARCLDFQHRKTKTPQTRFKSQAFDCPASCPVFQYYEACPCPEWPKDGEWFEPEWPIDGQGPS
jgi:hypothetical protein